MAATDYIFDQLYPKVQILKDFLKCADFDITLDNPDFESFLVTTVVAQMPAMVMGVPTWPQSFILEPTPCTMQALLLQVIQAALSRMQTSARHVFPFSSVLASGYHKVREGSTGIHGLKFENTDINTVVMELQSPVWQLLLHHTSPAFVYFLLLFNNVFISRQTVFFQVAGIPITHILKATPSAQITSRPPSQPSWRHRYLSRSSVFYHTSATCGVGLPPNHLLNRVDADADGARSLIAAVCGQDMPLELPEEVRPLLDVLRKLIRNHHNCDYRAILDHACPICPELQVPVCSVQEEQSSQESLSSQEAPPESEQDFLVKGMSAHAQVAAFASMVFRAVIPRSLVGAGSARLVLGRIRRVVSLRRHTTLSLHQLMQGFKVTGCTWFRSTRRMGREAAQLLTQFVGEVVFWVFNDFLLPLLRNNFYLTDGERSAVMYYRHRVWRKISLKALASLSSMQYRRLDGAQVSQIMLHPARTIGVSKLRLFPKQRGLRPIVNMATTSIIRPRGHSGHDNAADVPLQRKRARAFRRGGCFSKAWNSDGRGFQRCKRRKCSNRRLPRDNNFVNGNISSGSNSACGILVAVGNGSSNCDYSCGVNFMKRSQSDGCRELSAVRHGLTKRAHSDSSLLMSKRCRTDSNFPQGAQRPLGRLFRPVNSCFRPHFEVLKYEKDRNPGLLGASVFGLNEIYSKFKHFVGHVRAIARTSKTPPMIYAVAVDLRHCFDTINREKLMGILNRVLSQESYCIQRYAVVHRAGNALRSKELKLVYPASEIPKFTAISNPRYDHCVFVDGVTRQYLSREAISKLLSEHLNETIVEAQGQYFQQINGIPQGSVLSGLLCGMYLGYVERNSLIPRMFSAFKTPETQLGQDVAQLLLRQVDDYLFLTTSEACAMQFRRVMNQGFAEFGLSINLHKTRVEEHLYCSSTTKRCASGWAIASDDAHLIWNGLRFDLPSLELHVDYRLPMRPLNLEPTLPSGTALRRSMKRWIQSKMHPLFLDQQISSARSVAVNVYQCFSSTALKFWSTLTEIRLCSAMGTMHNPRFILEVIFESIEYLLHLVDRRFRELQSVPMKRCQCSIKRSTSHHPRSAVGSISLPLSKTTITTTTSPVQTTTLNFDMASVRLLYKGLVDGIEAQQYDSKESLGCCLPTYPLSHHQTRLLGVTAFLEVFAQKQCQFREVFRELRRMRQRPQLSFPLRLYPKRAKMHIK